MPSYCSNCGDRIPDDAKKCQTCGAVFEGEEIMKTTPETYSDHVNSVPPAKTRNWAITVASLLFFGFGILVLILIAAFLFDSIATAQSITSENSININLSQLIEIIFALFIITGAIQIIIGYLLWKNRKIGGTLGMAFCALFGLVAFFYQPANMGWFWGLWIASLIIRPILILAGWLFESEYWK